MWPMCDIWGVCSTPEYCNGFLESPKKVTCSTAYKRTFFGMTPIPKYCQKCTFWRRFKCKLGGVWGLPPTNADQAPTAANQTPTDLPTKRRLPPTKRRLPPTKRRLPPIRNRPVGVCRGTPPGVWGLPPTKRRLLPTKRRPNADQTPTAANQTPPGWCLSAFVGGTPNVMPSIVSLKDKTIGKQPQSLYSPSYGTRIHLRTI